MLFTHNTKHARVLCYIITDTAVLCMLIKQIVFLLGFVFVFYARLVIGFVTKLLLKQVP